MSTNLEYLTERLKSKDKKTLISVLAALRHKLNGKNPHYTIDSTSFKLIISFFKMPNQKLLNYSISIVGNCCMHERYRKDFSETSGSEDLIMILGSIGQDDIACRAWRLVGNLVSSSDLCRTLLNLGLSIRMADFLGTLDIYSSSTRLMLHRAIGKCWNHKFARIKIASDGFSRELKGCLRSKDPDTVISTLGLFSNILSKSNAFTVDRPVIVELVELSKRKELYTVSMQCLSAIVSYHVCSHLIEGSGLAEVFITHLQQNEQVQRDILDGFYKLCREGAVRNKVKTANLLHVLIRLCRGPNVSLILQLFLLFQYDQPSILILARSDELLCVLVENIASPHAVALLTIMARLEQPVPALVSHYNLDIFTSSSQCNHLLTTIVKSRKYFKSILVSGRVWALSRAGCPMDEVGSSGYSEGVMEHCLLTSDEKRKRIVALAVPFLVKPRNFTMLYKLLAKHEAINVILQALKENPTDDSVVASIVRLTTLFREQQRGQSGPNDLDSAQLLFLHELLEPSDLQDLSASTTPSATSSNAEPSQQLITFELENGMCVTGSRTILCAQSPVIDAMLNGHFSEAGKDRVKLPQCSRSAVATLVKLAEGKMGVTSDIDMDTHLELVTLTDRLLMPQLGNVLTRSVALTGANCAKVYLWSRKAGDAANAALLRARAYWQLLSSTTHLAPALEDPVCREHLVSDITGFLSACVGDLL